MADTFPHDWHAWRAQWVRWLAHQPVTPVVRPDTIPAEKNLMADEILGYYRLPDGRIVELSECYIPAPLGPDRLVGYTIAPHPDGGTGVVDTFTELAEVLGLTKETDA